MAVHFEERTSLAKRIDMDLMISRAQSVEGRIMVESDTATYPTEING